MLRLLCFSAIATSLLVPGLVVAQTADWQTWTKQNPTYPGGLTPAKTSTPGKSATPAAKPKPAPAPQTTVQVNQSNIVVYGRTSCGLTKRMIQDLQAQKIAYQFKSVDTPAVNQEFWQILRQSGVKSNSIKLPVITVKGNVVINPTLEKVLAQM